MKHIFNLNIISIEKEIFSSKIEFVILSGEEGELGIYPYHARLITRIQSGIIRIKLQNKIPYELIFVAGGILEVQPQKVTILADIAIRSIDLDEIQANKTKQIAEEILANRNFKIDHVTAQATLAIAVAQLKAIQQLRQKNHTF